MTNTVYSSRMKLTVKLKLLTTAADKATLLKTMEVFNSAANDAAEIAFANHVFSRPSVHNLTYYTIRESTGLTSQLVVRAIGKAVECFKRDKSVCPVFKPRSAVVYDQRIMRFKGLTHVSLASVNGRLTIPMVVAGYQKNRLQAAIKTGQADLVYIQGTFYLLVSIEIEPAPARQASDVIGVDLGVAQIAVDSEGNAYTVEALEKYRIDMQRMRDILQSVGTRSANRHLKRIARKESNYRRTANHQIARRIVDLAKEQNSAIALEDLKAIRERIRFRRRQRARMTGWSFNQLRSFIAYKAELLGVPLIIVDARNTSRTCHECGYCDKANRKSQSEFKCQSCAHESDADLNAARNIRAKGCISKPIVTNVDSRALAATS